MLKERAGAAPRGLLEGVCDKCVRVVYPLNPATKNYFAEIETNFVASRSTVEECLPSGLTICLAFHFSIRLNQKINEPSREG